MSDLRFVPRPGAFDDILDDPDVDDMLQDIGDAVAEKARSFARRDTGAGAESIHAEVHRGSSEAFASTYTPEDDAPTAYVSWDQDHYYMLFSEVGTEDEPAQPALLPALEGTEI